MNKIRRKELQVIAEQLEELKDALETIKGEEENYMKNMPENLWGSERYETAEEAVSSMDSAVDSLEEAISSIEEAAGED